MSRSTRKTPIFGITTSESEKHFKSTEHRRERRAVKISLAEGDEPADPKAFGDPWRGDKDGKRYWNGATPADMRK